MGLDALVAMDSQCHGARTVFKFDLYLRDTENDHRNGQDWPEFLLKFFAEVELKAFSPLSCILESGPGTDSGLVWGRTHDGRFAERTKLSKQTATSLKKV